MEENIVRIGGFQKLTLLDYPGQVACIIFTAGCNFRCPFCQNSSLLGVQNGAPIAAENLSPGGEAQNEQGRLPAQEGDDIRLEEIFEYLKKRKGMLDGVVLSGGEPLMQPGIVEMIRKIRKLGFLIKADTNGSFPQRLEYLLSEGLLDYVAMDIKSGRKGYPAACGRSDRRTAESVGRSIFLLKQYYKRRAEQDGESEKKGKTAFRGEFRTTLVRGIHSRRDVEEIAALIGDDIPYYLQSYSDAGDILNPKGLSSFSQEELQDMLQTARRHCARAELRK